MTPVAPRSREGRVFLAVILLLFTAGWAANHFASMIVVLREITGLTPLTVNTAFGVYAIGLLPGLLGGGVVADRFGSRPVVLTGAVLAAAGNAGLMFWNDAAGLMVGRLLVGVGVGLAISAGTAWAGRLRGVSGTTLAGICLTAGFASGPIVSGVVAAALLDHPAAEVMLPFVLSVVLSVVAIGYALFVGDVDPAPAPVPSAAGSATAAEAAPNRSFAKALVLSIPMSLWVFACVTTALVVLAARVAPRIPVAAVLVPGIASLLAFSAALIVQALGRRRGWGPWSGVVGATSAAIGFLLAGVAGADPTIWLYVVMCLLLGSAYGFCLRQGLTDVEVTAPASRRGAAVGVFYVFAYLGFGLPALTELTTPVFGPTALMIGLAVLAVACALIRTVQIRSGYLVRP